MEANRKKSRKGKKDKELVFYTHFEEVLARIHPFGPYQIFCCIVILYATIEWAGNATFMDSLGQVEPDAWICTFSNGSTVDLTKPMDDTKCAFKKDNCANFTANRTDLGFYSVRAAFALVCDDDFKIKWIQVIQNGGLFIGSFAGGHIGDVFGRQTFFFVGQLLLIITSLFVTAAQGWLSFAIILLLNGLLYGVLETTSLTMMMEYTSNKFRLIHTACFQWPIAYMVLALIAYLTKGWQNHIIFVNLVASPMAIAFMLFLESPRWLVARNRMNEACNVLNDMAHERWNNTNAKFTTKDLSSIPKAANTSQFYSAFDLFKTRRLAKQTIMQILATFTYAIVSNTYLYTANGIHSNVIMFTFLDGVFRLFTPLLIIFLDFRFIKFGRKMQFVGALSLEGILFLAVIILIAVGVESDNISVTIMIIVTTMVNDCVFWMNIVQITTQRYPTVIRCIAFGTIHSIKYIGSIVSVLLLEPLVNKKSTQLIAFIVPEVLIIITLVAGIFLQPETKGKALMDQMKEANYGRLENAIPKALIRLAAGHRVRQVEVKEDLRKQMHADEIAISKGLQVDSPWQYRGEEEGRSRVPSRVPSIHPEIRIDEHPSDAVVEIPYEQPEASSLHRVPSAGYRAPAVTMVGVTSNSGSSRETEDTNVSEGYSNEAYEMDDVADRHEEYEKEYDKRLRPAFGDGGSTYDLTYQEDEDGISLRL